MQRASRVRRRDRTNKCATETQRHREKRFGTRPRCAQARPAFGGAPRSGAERSGSWQKRERVVCRPFASVTILLGGADLIWLGLDRKDWLEAFAHHPRIGERDLSQTKFAATAIQAGKEQSGMAVATDAQRAEFAAGNEQYEQKFGHVFLICATGKIASQMLEQLRQRLNNDAAAELTNAAREQSAITRLRLERWLNT